MNTLQFIIKKILYPSCAIFTLLWLMVCGIIDAVSDIVNINFSSGMMCLVIAIAISVSNQILTKNTIAPIGRYFLHMLSTVVSISLVVALFSTTFKTKYALTGNSFYLVLILIVFYLVVATPMIVLYFRKSKKTDSKDYQSMFRK